MKTRIVPVEAERHSGHSAQVCSAAQPRHRHRCEHGSSRTARGSSQHTTHDGPLLGHGLGSGLGSGLELGLGLGFELGLG